MCTNPLILEYVWWEVQSASVSFKRQQIDGFESEAQAAVIAEIFSIFKGTDSSEKAPQWVQFLSRVDLMFDFL